MGNKSLQRTHVTLLWHWGDSSMLAGTLSLTNPGKANHSTQHVTCSCVVSFGHHTRWAVIKTVQCLEWTAARTQLCLPSVLDGQTWRQHLCYVCTTASVGLSFNSQRKTELTSVWKIHGSGCKTWCVWGYPQAMETHLTQAGLKHTQYPDAAKGKEAGVINDRSATGRQLGGGKEQKLGSRSQPWHAENVAEPWVDAAGRQSSPKTLARANRQNNRKNLAWLRQWLHRTQEQQEGPPVTRPGNNKTTGSVWGPEQHTVPEL